MDSKGNSFSSNIEKVVKSASKIAMRFGCDVVGTEHILYGLASVKGCTASRILEDFGVTEEDLFELFAENAEEEGVFGSVELAPRVKELFRIAQQIAVQMESTYIGSEHLLLALLSSNGSVALKLLQNHYSINIGKITTAVYNALQGKNAKSGDNAKNMSDLPEKLLEMGTDITLKAKEGKLDPVIGREHEIQRLVEILCRKTKNNPVLIGEAGVGKTAVVEGLAQKRSEVSKFSKHKLTLGSLGMCLSSTQVLS